MSPPPLDALSELHRCLRSLGEQYASIVSEVELRVLHHIRDGFRPDPDVLARLQELLQSHDNAIALLKSCDESIREDLSVTELVELVGKRRSRAAWKAMQSSAMSVLSSILRIRMASGADSPVLSGVQVRAQKLLDELKAELGEPDTMDSRLVPFVAFWRLLANGEELSDDESDELTSRVEIGLGRPVVRPAFFRQLITVQEPATVEDLASPALTTDDAVSASIETEAPTVGPVSQDEVAVASTDESQRIVSNAIPRSESDAADSLEALHPAESPRCSVIDAPMESSEWMPIPVELSSFAEFASRYWINPVSLGCEPAPWLRNDFKGRVTAIAARERTAVAAGDITGLATWHICARALAELGGETVNPATLRDVASILAEPTKTSAGRDPLRMARLLYSTSSEELSIGLVVEALRPTHTELPDHEQLEQLISRAGYQTPLRTIITSLFHHHLQYGDDPIATLRRALAKEPDEVVDWESELQSRRKKVQEEVKRITLNAGSGTIGRFPHCSRAWTRFMTECVIGWVSELYPGPAFWDADSIERRISRLKKQHADIAEAAEARKGSRKTMDRAVTRLVEILTDANDALRECKRDSDQEKKSRNLLLEDARALLNAAQPVDEVDRIAYAILRRVLSGAGTSLENPLQVTPLLFLSYPRLLDLLDGPINSKDLSRVDHFGGDARQVASAILYKKETPSKPLHWYDVELQARVEKRFDRIAKLQGQIPDRDHGAAAQEKNRLLIEKHARVERVRRAWRMLETLSVPEHRTISGIIEWLRAQESDVCDPMLLAVWLDRLAESCENQVQAARSAWQRSLSDTPVDETRLLAFQRGQYDRAIRGIDSPIVSSRSPRETLWRTTAKTSMESPRQLLVDFAPTLKVAEKWIAELGDRSNRHNALSSMRSEFTRWVFGEELSSVAEKSSTRFAIETAHIRRQLAALQPTYLPQLHSAKSLVVITVSESPTERGYSRKVVDTISEHGVNAIVVALCPMMTLAVREQIRIELHNTNLFAATLDDLDLCRLLNPGGTQPNLLIGLLEIVLEQQPWKARNPFSVPEGSEMRLEMYVGRREEAEQLATTSAKTRLFSGRKLGKTALLQFIRQTWNGKELPSGRKLRVVYVSIVGVSSEEMFARKVCKQLASDFPASKISQDVPSPAAVLDVLRSLLEEHPDIDLLFVLDEADEFVLSQIREYDSRKEACLSFQLREPLTVSGIVGTRVRYVFTGYRATATRDGVWYNWGDVLELSQLSVDEAAGLIARPLARMGIDATEQAAEIAFRCGYQPAVLLKFGERLVERMAEDGYLEGAKVTHELVQDTFEDAKVQAEIQGVVRANFQGNPFGRAVFGVVLQESARAPLGHWLQGVDQTAARVFRDVFGPIAEPDLVSVIAAQLRDMHLRKLLHRKIVDAQPEYQLRFPHHLATLLADLDLETEVVTNLRAWQNSGGGPGEIAASEGRSPIHRNDLAILRDMLRPEMSDLVSVIAIGSLWESSLDHEPGGIHDRLGLQLQDPASAVSVPSGRNACWRGATRQDLERALANPPPNQTRVLLGGVDLIRSAVEYRQSRSVSVEAIGPYRMTDGQVRWWFQRILGVEFASEQAYVDVHTQTAGIPVLVGEFEKILLPNGPPPGGVNLSCESLTEAFDSFSLVLEQESFSSKFGSQLKPRELDLARMAYVISVALECGEAPVGEYLTTHWDDGEFRERWSSIFAGREYPLAYLGHDEDPVAIETLLLTGILPSASLTGEAIYRVGGIAPKDPLSRILIQLR